MIGKLSGVNGVGHCENSMLRPRNFNGYFLIGPERGWLIKKIRTLKNKGIIYIKTDFLKSFFINK
tara:strand:- start:2223 stop:2417 length:195 start_codon:yes stop_codon:yes gene_type:complete